MRKVTGFFFLFFLSLSCFSQTCTNCTYTVTSYDTTDYVIGTGQTLCIDTNGIVAGNVTLSGGTICNNGSIDPVSFTVSNGTISNYSSIILKGNISIGSTLTWTNNSGGKVNVSGTLSISGGNVSNSGIINVSSNLNLSGGSLTNTSIINCTTLNNSGGSYNNSGIVNSN